MAKNSEKKTPVFDMRVNHVRACVWENHTDDRRWFNSVFTRRHKDGDEWKDATTFNGLGDLALLREALELAHEFIVRAEMES